MTMAPEPSLEALFGTSVGDVGALLVGTSRSTSSTAAPKPGSQPAVHRPASVSAEKITSIPPSSVVVTVADLQDLVKQGVITEDVGKAVWDGFLRQHADRKTQAAWGKQVLRRLRRGCVEVLQEHNVVEGARLAMNEHQKVDGTGESKAVVIDKKPSGRETAASKVTSAGSTKLNALFGASVGEVGELLAGSPHITSQAISSTLQPSALAHELQHVLVPPNVAAEETHEAENTDVTASREVVGGLDDLAGSETTVATQDLTQIALQVQDADESLTAIDKNPGNRETAASKGTLAESKKLDDLFGTSVGEIGELLAASFDTTPLAIAPKQNLKPSVLAAESEQLSHAPSVATKEADETRTPNKTPSLLVIEKFDDLADFETIAVTQGLTEDDLLGDMTIVDASSNRYTWDTFPPTAKFPITMEFISTDATQGQNANDGRNSPLAESKEDQQKLVSLDSSGAAPKSRKKRRQRGSASDSSIQGAAAQSEPLQSLFGTCVGELGTLLASTDAHVTASAQHLAASLSMATTELAPDVIDVSTKETRIVVINEFDDLAEIESIAAEQGLTESDLEGDLTIIDACGIQFSWETFSPSAKFPIQLHITPKDSVGYTASGNRKAADQYNTSRLSSSAGAKSTNAAARVAISKGAARKQKRR